MTVFWSNFECFSAEVDCAFEQSKEGISSRVELKYSVSRARTGGDCPPAGRLVPSDCHWRVFLDDIDMEIYRYGSYLQGNML